VLWKRIATSFLLTPIIWASAWVPQNPVPWFAVVICIWALGALFEFYRIANATGKCCPLTIPGLGLALLLIIQPLFNRPELLWLGITLAVSGPLGASPGRSGIHLEQSYPNPAQSSAIIEFNLNQAGHTVLKIYNQLGQEMAKLVDQDLKAGKHVVRWEGVEASSGVYYYQLQTPEGTETKKLVLMR